MVPGTYDISWLTQFEISTTDSCGGSPFDSFFATEGHTVRARTQFDLSAGFTPTDYLSFAAGVINLNNSREEAYYNNNPSIWQESSFYGRSFYLSATLRM